MLSAEEIERYPRDGYVIPTDLQLTREELADAGAALEQVIEANPDILADRLT